MQTFGIKWAILKAFFRNRDCWIMIMPCGPFLLDWHYPVLNKSTVPGAFITNKPNRGA